LLAREADGARAEDVARESALVSRDPRILSSGSAGTGVLVESYLTAVLRLRVGEVGRDEFVRVRL